MGNQYRWDKKQKREVRTRRRGVDYIIVSAMRHGAEGKGAVNPNPS
jgi:hypothetical protein